ncbi:hypothetical protein GOV13_05125 [Candidatus Pacearchaeota archaeon]|nr:hypothetical protein [Candidatus Pacearchaeota archaeon]
MKNKKNHQVPTISKKYSDETIVEMLYNQDETKTSFAIWKDGKVEIASKYKEKNGKILVPYKSTNNLIKHNIVLFPSKPIKYKSEKELISEIQSFIHKYVDLSPLFEKIATYYILLSWVYDSFKELPYLRKRGDFGSGKTRFLQIVGSICYKPIFATGGASTASLFHILDQFRGTLIIDEGDFRFSDEKAEIIKILNNGNVEGFPVLRCQANPNGEFNPIGFQVFGTKIIATRAHYQDRALESRFLSEDFSPKKLRPDIPITLPDKYKDEALALRNKLLFYRFKKLGTVRANEKLAIDSIEPRLNQMFIPLLSVIEDESVRDELKELAKIYSEEMVLDRGSDIEADVLFAIKELLNEENKLSIKEVSNKFFLLFGENYNRSITPKWIGRIIRKKLGLKTVKSHGSYIIDSSQLKKLKLLFERYDL